MYGFSGRVYMPRYLQLTTLTQQTADSQEEG